MTCAACPCGARPCAYCLGWYRPARAHAVTCSGACRQARSVALRTEEPLTPPWRAETWSADRAAATGWGGLTPREQYAADVRVRRAEGLPVVVVDRYLSDDDGGALLADYHRAACSAASSVREAA